MERVTIVALGLTHHRELEVYWSEQSWDEMYLQGMQRQFELEFRLKLMPVVDQISKEKGLHFVFGLEQSTMIVWWSRSLDISAEIVKRLDATP